jgi:HSP20 family molecular chaperone IbpA
MARAGCRPEDIDVTVENDVVRIRGRFPEHFEMGTSGGQAMLGQAGQPSLGQPAQGHAMSGQQQTGRGETCLVRELPSGRFERAGELRE